MRVLVNGDAVESISISDRGCQYGDGVFETIRVRNARIPLWSLHMQRCLEGCSRLGIDFPGESVLLGDVRRLLMGVKNAVLKIIITRGAGPRGYQCPRSSAVTRILSVYELPQNLAINAQKGVRLRVCETRLGLNPALAGIKHMNRLEQILARREWDDDYEEGIMLDYDGYVRDGVMSNLFMVKGDALFTPSLAGCGVNGVLRRWIFAYADEQNIALQEGDYTLEEWQSCDAMFISNALIGVWPVREFLHAPYAIHSMTQRINKALEVSV